MTALKYDFFLSGDTKVCADCGKDQPASEYSRRTDRPHRPVACCKGCIRTRNRFHKAVSRARVLEPDTTRIEYIAAPMFHMGDPDRSVSLVASVGRFVSLPWYERVAA